MRAMHLAPSKLVMRNWLRRTILIAFAALGLLALATALSPSRQVTLTAAETTPTKEPEHLDPAAWGADHVGQELPEFVDSGECLFCHRNDIGPTWEKNPHSQSIKDARPDMPAMRALADDPVTRAVAAETQMTLGGRHATSFLRRGAEFGAFDLLAAHATPGRGSRWRLHAASAEWDTTRFAQGCVGCHCTAVEPDTHAFLVASIDCYACHGAAPLEHSTDTKLMPLAHARHDAPRVVTSICAQCHIRFGKSKSSGLPYPNNFVADDNLFKDFQFDWSLADDPQVNPGDRHVLDNIRQVALLGNEQFTCLSCHDVHRGTSVKHRDLPDAAYCAHCHEPGKSKKEHIKYEVRSSLCGY
jgi:hypothetical protein